MVRAASPVRPCPVCSSEEFQVLFRDRNRRDNLKCWGTYVQCAGCSLVYLQDPPPWEDIVKFYSHVSPDCTANSGLADLDAVIREADAPVPLWKSWLRKVRFRPHSWPLEPVPPGSRRILDVGCGNGAKLLEFAKRGYEMWGIDVGSDAIDVCRQVLPNGHFVRGELQDAKLPEAFFDYIRIDNGLEHVPNPQEVVRECFRLLRPGGTLFLYVPHGRSLTMRFLKGDSVSSWIPFHLQLFTHRSLERLLHEAGFELVKLYGYSPPHWIPLSVKQMKTRIQKIQPTLIRVPSWLAGVCYPVAWFASKIGMAEELLGVGEKCSQG